MSAIRPRLSAGIAAACAAIATAALAVPVAEGPALLPPALAATAEDVASLPVPTRPPRLPEGEDLPAGAAPVLATLVQVHTDEHLVLDRSAPEQSRFDTLLGDRTTGSLHALDPRLLGLLRTLAERHQSALGPPRIELVSGYRSPRLNEMLRKKGHHVASHSQHSKGHAVDFRIVPAGAAKALDPRAVEKEIRRLGWDGGVGVYPTQADWFVHADVGPNRKWIN